MRPFFALSTILLVTAPGFTSDTAPAAVPPQPAQPAKAGTYPHATVNDRGLKFKLYEIDAKKGFYRGTRFDHAGVFGEVELAGHTVFGPWKGRHDPDNHDDIVGPCDEFGIDSPLGYDAAQVGGTFLKIGVGELEKPKEARYSFANKYKVVKPLEWKTSSDVPGATFPCWGWQANQSANGYGYRFTKMLSVNRSRAPGAPASVTLEYGLKNTGEKRIVTDFYNHNFFNVDGDPIGPNYSLTFPCTVTAHDLKGKFGTWVELKGKDLRFQDKVADGDLMARLDGFDPKNETHRRFEMRHAPSGVSATVQHSYPFAKFNVWGIRSTLCPEPYMAIDLKPGEETKWSITYTFTHEPPKK